MFYRLFINYLRLKLIRLMVSRVTSKKNNKIKSMSLIGYGLEFLATYLLDNKKKKK